VPQRDSVDAPVLRREGPPSGRAYGPDGGGAVRAMGRGAGPGPDSPRSSGSPGGCSARATAGRHLGKLSADGPSSGRGPARVTDRGEGFRIEVPPWVCLLASGGLTPGNGEPPKRVSPRIGRVYAEDVVGTEAPWWEPIGAWRLSAQGTSSTGTQGIPDHVPKSANSIPRTRPALPPTCSERVFYSSDGGAKRVY
jgi:hypothetical protein